MNSRIHVNVKVLILGKNSLICCTVVTFGHCVLIDSDKISRMVAKILKCVDFGIELKGFELMMFSL